MPGNPTHGRSTAGDDSPTSARPHGREAEAGLDTAPAPPPPRPTHDRHRARRDVPRPTRPRAPRRPRPARRDDHTTASDIIRKALRRYLEAS